jgi:centrosomal protein CEP72
MAELDRLKYNPALTDLDLRLNPVTKEENDYRLFLIKIVPSLKQLDDRSIRDGERQMASSLFDQKHLAIENSAVQPGNEADSNSFKNNGISSRAKSVSNIAKRSAGLFNRSRKIYRFVDEFKNVVILRRERERGM